MGFQMVSEVQFGSMFGSVILFFVAVCRRDWELEKALLLSAKEKGEQQGLWLLLQFRHIRQPWNFH